MLLITEDESEHCGLDASVQHSLAVGRAIGIAILVVAHPDPNQMRTRGTNGD